MTLEKADRQTEIGFPSPPTSLQTELPVGEHETTHTWNDLAPELKKFVLEAHSKYLKSTNQKATMQKIFDMANPKMVIGANGDKHYCRVHEESVAVMQLLIKSYL